MKLEGLNELRVALDPTERINGVKKIVALNGSELQASAQRKAPVDTGTLRRSIKLSLKKGGMRAEIEAEADYAPYQEYGTRFMNAQPYMKPAFNEQEGKFKNDLDRLMK